MISYVMLDAAGVVHQHGQCSEAAHLPQVEGMTVEIVEDADSLMVVPPETTYQDFRRMDYPTFGDQLDALWRVMSKTEAFAADPEAKAMFARIQEVKLQYPKSTEDS
jgi:hypothetical protein